MKITIIQLALSGVYKAVSDRCNFDSVVGEGVKVSAAGSDVFQLGIHPMAGRHHWKILGVFQKAFGMRRGKAE